MMDIVDRLKAMGGYLDYDCEVTLFSIADEIQTLRAKVASAELLVGALQESLGALGNARFLIHKHLPNHPWNSGFDRDIQSIRKALATYEKQSEIK